MGGGSSQVGGGEGGNQTTYLASMNGLRGAKSYLCGRNPGVTSAMRRPGRGAATAREGRNVKGQGKWSGLVEDWKVRGPAPKKKSNNGSDILDPRVIQIKPNQFPGHPAPPDANWTAKKNRVTTPHKSHVWQIALMKKKTMSSSFSSAFVCAGTPRGQGPGGASQGGSGRRKRRSR
jgi:hypothetical protein